MRARVAIGMPVFQAERFLAQALSAVVAQDFGDLEVLVSDNGSTDGTQEIARDFAARDERVRYRRNEENLGAAQNFNVVVNETASELFKWAAGDDLIAPTFVSSCVAALDADPGLVLAYPRAVDVDAEGAVVFEHEPMPHATDPEPSRRFGRITVELGHCFSVFGVTRRSALERTGLIRPYAAADRMLLAELALLGRFHEVPDPLFLHREHEDRSVRQYRARQRGGWYDPSRAGDVTLPAWRQTVEFARAVHRAPLDRAERRRAYLNLHRWARRKWKVHLGNVYDAARQIGGSAWGGRSLSGRPLQRSSP